MISVSDGGASRRSSGVAGRRPRADRYDGRVRPAPLGGRRNGRTCSSVRGFRCNACSVRSARRWHVRASVPMSSPRLGRSGYACPHSSAIPAGWLFWGSFAITIFVLSDLVDGALARARGITGPWGAFLDSSLDRVADSAVFAGLIWWFARDGKPVLLGLCIFCLIAGNLVSYTRARAEGLGLARRRRYRRARRTHDRHPRGDRAERARHSVRPGRRAVVARGGECDHRRPAVRCRVPAGARR